jgi:hypothetical protein
MRLIIYAALLLTASTSFAKDKHPQRKPDPKGIKTVTDDKIKTAEDRLACLEEQGKYQTELQRRFRALRCQGERVPSVRCSRPRPAVVEHRQGGAHRARRRRAHRRCIAALHGWRRRRRTRCVGRGTPKNAVRSRIATRHASPKPSSARRGSVAASASRSPMTKKFLCMCQGGCVRSVALAHILKYPYEQDAIACGWEGNTPETREMLYKWADYIVLMQPEFIKHVPDDHHRKVRVADVGIDRFGSSTHSELRGILKPIVAEWAKTKFHI